MVGQEIIVTVEAANEKSQRREHHKDAANAASINLAELTVNNIASDNIKDKDVDMENSSKNVIKEIVFAWHIYYLSFKILRTSTYSWK